MAITGSMWDLPNYLGELHSASPTQTPLVTQASGGDKFVQNDEFPLSVEYSLATAAQNVKSENDADTAPSAVDVTRSQTKNVIQIQQHAIKVTYKKMSSNNRLTGIADLGGTISVADEMAFQRARKLETIKRDQEVSAINGTYVASSAETVAQANRGMFEAISDASNGVAAGGADLSVLLINQMLREAYADGATFGRPAFMVNAFQAQQLDDLYSVVPLSRTVGGSAINSIVTIFGTFEVHLNPHMDTDDLLYVDLMLCSNVWQPVPNKGPLFSEALSKLGASDREQLYSQWGFDYGPAWEHNAITGLSTS